MKKIIRVSLVIALCLWMLLIFSLSAETATESADKSGGFSYKIAAFFVPGFEEMPVMEQQEIIEKMSFPIRKGAHFCIFAVLSLLAFFNIAFFDKLSNFLKYSLSFAFCALYAASDEFHQNFVVGRSCEFRDWLIDCGGVLAGLLLCFVLIKIFSKKVRGYSKCEKKN